MRSSWAVRVGLVAAVAIVVAGTSLLAYGRVFGFDNPTATAGPTSLPSTAPSTTTTVAPTTTRQPTTTTTHPAMREPAHVAMPAGAYGMGSRGPAILAYEQRLKDLHFDPGPVDGRYTLDTMYAVTAVQKLYGLPRTGRIDAATRLAISAFQWPKSLVPAKTAEADRAEIDLDRQVLVLYTDWKITLITTVSTGSGRHFCGGDSGCQYAVTPPGKFHFQWFFNGWRTSKLGHLFNPYYFNGGIAVHGYTSVPPYPASHGCTRIPMDIAQYFHTLVHKGEAVYVIGTPSGPLVPPTPIPSPPTNQTTTTSPATTTPATTSHPTTTAPKKTTTTTAPKSTTTTTKSSTTTT